ncbi:DUF58 domain-containing protein [Paenibacillus sp. 1P07SE]|uniref:DUF58 domain-containing protein n=1 Tax=Paenibacillus sp. 1P07SE TaxID=3132209 RepID=UPI0039A681A0
MQIHWLILIVAALVLVQGQIFYRLGQKRLTYTRTFSETACYQGDRIEMVERIANRKPLPLPWLRIESMLHAGMRFQAQYNLDISNGQFVQNHKSFFSLLPYTQVTRRHQVTCTKRGVYRIHAVSLTCGDIFGVFNSSRRLQFDSELVVYPAPLPAEDLRIPSQSWQGDITVKRWIAADPFMIAGAREYRSGDSLKDVNWKATARAGALQVHQHDFTADQRLLILINIEDHERMWGTVRETERVELAIRYAAGLAQYALAQGIETGFGINARLEEGPREPVRSEPRSGADQLDALQELMARLVIEPSTPFSDMLEAEAVQAGRTYDYLLLSAFVSDKMTTAIERLRRGGHRVEVLDMTALPAADDSFETPDHAAAAVPAGSGGGESA